MPPKVSGTVGNLKIYGLSRNKRSVFVKTLMRFGAQRDDSGAFAWLSGLEHLTPKAVEAMQAYGRKVGLVMHRAMMHGVAGWWECMELRVVVCGNNNDSVVGRLWCVWCQIDSVASNARLI